MLSIAYTTKTIDVPVDHSSSRTKYLAHRCRVCIHATRIRLCVSQAVRNLDDLECLACPPKYRELKSFYKYYTRELKAPYLTIFSASVLLVCFNMAAGVVLSGNALCLLGTTC